MKIKKGDKVSDMAWYAAECRAQQWFEDKQFNCYQAAIGNKGWDLLVNNRYRINVKYSDGRQSNHDELEFFLHYSYRSVETDYFLFMFSKSFDSLEQRRYLVPADLLCDRTVLYFDRHDIPSWMKCFKLTKQECLLLFDTERTGFNM